MCCSIFCRVCALGGRLLSYELVRERNGTSGCTKNVTGPLYQLYCGDAPPATAESCEFFMKQNLTYYAGIPGLRSGKIFGEFLRLEWVGFVVAAPH